MDIRTLEVFTTPDSYEKKRIPSWYIIVKMSIVQSTPRNKQLLTSKKLIRLANKNCGGVHPNDRYYVWGKCQISLKMRKIAENGIDFSGTCKGMAVRCEPHPDRSSHSL